MPTLQGVFASAQAGQTIKLVEGVTYTLDGGPVYNTLDGIRLNRNGARIVRTTKAYPAVVNFGDHFWDYGGRTFALAPSGTYDKDEGGVTKVQPDLSAYGLSPNVSINRNDYAECSTVSFGNYCRFFDLEHVGAAGLMLSASADGTKAVGNRVDGVLFDRYCFGVIAHDQTGAVIRSIEGLGAVQLPAWSAAGAYGHLVYFNYSALFSATGDALSTSPDISEVTERNAYAAKVVDHYCTLKMRMCEDLRVSRVRTDGVPGFGDFIGTNGTVSDVVQAGGSGNTSFATFRQTTETAGNGARAGGAIVYTNVSAASDDVSAPRYRLEVPGAEFVDCEFTGGGSPVVYPGCDPAVTAS